MNNASGKSWAVIGQRLALQRRLAFGAPLWLYWQAKLAPLGHRQAPD